MGVLSHQVKSQLGQLNPGLSVVEPSRSGGTQPAAGLFPSVNGIQFGGDPKGFLDRLNGGSIPGVGPTGNFNQFSGLDVQPGGRVNMGALDSLFFDPASGQVVNAGTGIPGTSTIAPAGGLNIQDLAALLDITGQTLQGQGDGGASLAAALGSQGSQGTAEPDPFAQTLALSDQLLNQNPSQVGAQADALRRLGEPPPQQVKVQDQNPQNAFRGTEQATQFSGLLDFINRILSGG